MLGLVVVLRINGTYELPWIFVIDKGYSPWSIITFLSEEGIAGLFICRIVSDVSHTDMQTNVPDMLTDETSSNRRFKLLFWFFSSFACQITVGLSGVCGDWKRGIAHAEKVHGFSVLDNAPCSLIFTPDSADSRSQKDLTMPHGLGVRLDNRLYLPLFCCCDNHQYFHHSVTDVLFSTEQLWNSLSFVGSCSGGKQHVSEGRSNCRKIDNYNWLFGC